jgi:hypothetical protein
MKSNIDEGTRPASLSSSAIALSLAGGIIILFGSIIPLLFFANYSYEMPGMMGGMMMGGPRGLGMMWFGPGLMGGWFYTSFFLIPMISGIVVIVGAIMMSKRSHEATIWGIVVLVFSVLGLTGMGLAILGSILGIIGGAIALSGTKRHSII